MEKIQNSLRTIFYLNGPLVRKNRTFEAGRKKGYGGKRSMEKGGARGKGTEKEEQGSRFKVVPWWEGLWQSRPWRSLQDLACLAWWEWFSGFYAGSLYSNKNGTNIGMSSRRRGSPSQIIDYFRASRIQE